MGAPSGSTRPDQCPAAVEQISDTDITAEVNMICHAAGRNATSTAIAMSAANPNSCRHRACGLDGRLAR